MTIQIKELATEECKLRRICRQIKNNGKLNNIRINKTKYDEIIEYDEIIYYNFGVLYNSRWKRITHIFPFSVAFCGKLNTETYTLTIGNVEEHLFDKIYTASKLLFNDIDGLTVVIEKDYC